MWGKGKQTFYSKTGNKNHRARTNPHGTKIGRAERGSPCKFPGDRSPDFRYSYVRQAFRPYVRRLPPTTPRHRTTTHPPPHHHPTPHNTLARKVLPAHIKHIIHTRAPKEFYRYTLPRKYGIKYIAKRTCATIYI